MRGSGRYHSLIGRGVLTGLDEDKLFNVLVSRVACTAKLQHKSIGYSGPLSREMLSFRSLISEVRSTSRNLIEVVLTGMLLSGDADRDRKDWTELSIKYVDFSVRDSGSDSLGSPLSTTTIAVWELPFARTSMTFLFKATRHLRRRGLRLRRRARNGSSTAKASLGTWIWHSSSGMR